MISYCRIEWLLSSLIEIYKTIRTWQYHIILWHVMSCHGSHLYLTKNACCQNYYPCLVHFSVAWAVRTNVKSDQQRIITLSPLWRRAHKWRWHLLLRVARPVYTSKKLLLLLLLLARWRSLIPQKFYRIVVKVLQGKSVSLCLKMRF